jgi:thiosulfate dehydrogenase [quinone] large subunit
MSVKTVKTTQGTEIVNPPLARFLFDDTRLAALWLIVRVYLGYQWIQASLHKLSDPGWMQTGDALKGFWAGAVAVNAQGKGAITYDWYRSFLQFLIDSGSYVGFAKIIACGEFLVGLGLIVGAFVGVAAFFGALMNWNFMLAGSASTNPVLFLLAVLLILAWKTAGYYGVDRFLLPRLGTPWHRETAENKPVEAPVAVS